MIDQVIGAGRYRVGRLLARGGMAHVRLGLDVRTGRAVAVKYLNGEFLREESARRLFEAEATTAALDHPGVVRVLDSGSAEDLGTGISVPYLVMEFVPGESLSTLLRRDGAVGVDAALDLTVQLLEALAYCHAAGLVHRDIKPSNVMVTPSGRIRLVDFGVARHLGDTREQLDGVSRFVTTAYASPEQAQRSPTDSRSDLYSVGCVLYELLTGRPPFVGDAQNVLFERLVDEPTAPSAHNPEVSPDLDAVVLRSLRRDPGERHPSAEAMKDDLEGVVRSRRAPVNPQPVAAPEAPAADTSTWAAVTVLRPARPKRRRRAVRLTSGVAAALLPIVGFGMVHLRGAAQLDDAAMALSLGVATGSTSAAGGRDATLGWRPAASSAEVDRSCEVTAEAVLVPARVTLDTVAVVNAVTMLRPPGSNRIGAPAASTGSTTRPTGETAQRRSPGQSAEEGTAKPVTRAEPVKTTEPVTPKPPKTAEPVTPKPPKTADPVTPKPAKPVETKPSKPAKPVKIKPSKPAKPVKIKPSKPAKPVKIKPNKPAKVKPSKPAKIKPSKPAKVKPSKPAKPVKIKPSKPAKAKPSKPAKVKPSKPAKVKPNTPASTTDKPEPEDRRSDRARR